MIEIGSKTPKKYKFVLETGNGIYQLDTAIIEWAEMKVAFKRSKEFGGVFAEFIIGTCTFIEQGKDVLKTLYDEYGIRATATLRIYYLSRTTFEYKEFPTPYKLDFLTYKHIKKSKSTNAVQINALPYGLITKLNQRKSINVDLTRTESVGNIPLIPYSNFRPLLNIPAINAYYITNWKNETDYIETVGGQKIVSVPSEVITSDFTESQTIAYNGDILRSDVDYHHFKTSEQDRFITITANFKYKINGLLTRSATLYYAVINSDTSVADTAIVYTWVSAYEGIIKSVSYNKSVLLTTGQSIMFYLVVDLAVAQFIDLYIYENSINMSEPFVQSPSKTVDGFPVAQAIERNLQLITDMQYPFYSDFFGFTNMIRNIAGDYYTSENQLRFAHILNGLSIRGLPLSDTNNALTSNFMKLFNGLNALYNIGLGIEEIDGYDKIRIEERAYFYEDSEGLDLSDRISEFEIQEEVLGELVYSQIKSGFKSYEDEAVNGRGEYNTTNERTSDVENDNIFNNISDIRGDTRGVTKLLEKPIDESGSEDVKGDNGLFIIKSQRFGTAWKAETDENIQILNNTSLFKDGSLNLKFTPTRTLLEHKEELATSFIKKLDGKLTFQTAETLQTLQTTDGADDITENQDIEAADLGNPKWKPNLLIAECAFYEADYETLKINKNKYITLSSDKKGWVWDLEWTPSKNMATIKLVERWA